MSSGSDGTVTPWELHILDVGQGSSVVVVLPAENPQNRQALVIDSADAVATIDCLERCGVTSLPLVLITHSDEDHARGIPRVVERYWGSIGSIALNVDAWAVADKAWFGELLPSLKGGGAKDYYRPGHVPALAGSWPLRRVNLDSGVEEDYGELLYPSAQDLLNAFLGNDPNHASAILMLRLSGFRALFGGDLSLAGWSAIRHRLGGDASLHLKAELFVYPHHGADINGSTTALINEPIPPITDLELLHLISPAIVLVSVGTKQPGNYEHPRQQTFELLAKYRDQRQIDGRPFRLACTELTRRCHPDPITLREDALQILGRENTDVGYSIDHLNSCPCAATFSLRISPEDGSYGFIPNGAHQDFVDLVGSSGGWPGCRLVTS